jgi:hypothetical protein
MTPIDSTTPPRVESAEWITGLASVSALLFNARPHRRGQLSSAPGRCGNRLLCAPARNEESGESQCAEKFFCMSREAPEGDAEESKIKNSEIENRKIAQIKIADFLFF